MVAKMSPRTPLMIKPGAPTLRKPKPIRDEFAARLLIICGADVALKALALTDQDWHDILTPTTMIDKTSSINAQEPWVFIRLFADAGVIKQNNRQRKLTMSVLRIERKKILKACSFSFGSMIAWSYPKVTPAVIMPTTAAKEPDTPKSEGENRRLITGDRRKPITWAMPVPAMMTMMFLKNRDPFTFAIRSRRNRFTKNPAF